MHIRASMCRGMPVVDDATQDTVATLDDPVIDPDTGNIQGFFVSAVFSRDALFLQTSDIVGWGMQVHIRNADRLTPPDELIRLQRFFEGGRTVLGQSILTRGTKMRLGTCADVQFNTHHFTLEWLFPRKFFFYRQPVPVTEIYEVTKDAVWVNDPLRPTKVKKVEPKNVALDVLDPAVPEVMPTT